jgi:signal transduction histidine kinase
MAPLFDKLPTILVLAVLVGIFVALGRHVKSERLRLWTTAWILIFTHFFIGLFEPADGNLTPGVFIIDEGSLALAALFFIASLTSFFENKRLTLILLISAGIPVMGYTSALAYEWDQRVFYSACLATLLIGVPLGLALFRKVTADAFFWMPLTLGAGAVAIWRAWHHNYDFGFLAALTIGFALPGLLYCRRYRRGSPGVITSAGGFVLWGAVFPLAAAADAWAPQLHINPELWNTPKFFVALGMILTLLEDKSTFLKSAIEREHKLNRQLQKFSSITSRLLTGVDTVSLCPEIAEAITETSTFERVSIILSTDARSLFVAGYAGLEPEAGRLLEDKCQHLWKLEQIAEICRAGARLGQNSFLLRPAQTDKYGPIPSKRQFAPNPYWENGSVVVVPLPSTRGSYLGCLALDDPRDVARVTAEEMSKIELLAGDLAVTIDNSALHRQLARSEKLAAIGQLVAGVAHELNNPLTSIVGYSELLTDEITAQSPRQKLDKMIRESRRMKRIIENLLRFARQNPLEKTSANLRDLVHEVIALRGYHINEHHVDVRVKVEPGLPQVALDEDQFKQILLNLLNNSMDALDGVPNKRITIEATRRDDRIVVCFDDNGPGFSDTNRAFDPFYTTKPVGKGTGLGLSICYGIVQEHGGEIHAMNLEPCGARVVLELPIHTDDRVPSPAATVH